MSDPMHERVFLKERLATPEAPAHLQASIMRKIERSLIRQIWIEAIFAFLATISLSSYLSWSWRTIWLDLQASSFVPLTRLLVSDPDILFSNTREATWSLIETLPIQSLLLGLACVICVTCTIGIGLRLREVRQALSPQLT